MGNSPKPPTIRDYHFPPNALIGEGSFGWVWIGLFKGDQPRAVKVFKPHSIQEGLWQTEYEKLRALDEPPGIVTLYDRGHTDDEGLPYVSMRLMADRLANDSGWAGRTVSRALKASSLSVSDRWRIVREIAEILAYMHRQDVRHCDIKPGNILLSSGGESRPVLCDFGQSRTEGFNEGAAMGTLLYASPEQLCDPENPTKTWDVYSFGVTAFQILTDELPRLAEPVGAETVDSQPLPTDTLILQRETELTPLGQATIETWNPDLIVSRLQKQGEIKEPPGLNAVQRDDFGVITKCLELEPASRFEDMEQVVEAFQQAEKRRTLAGARRKQLLFAILTVIAVVAAGFAFWERGEANVARTNAEEALAVTDEAREKAVNALEAKEQALAAAEASNAEALRQSKLAEAAAKQAKQSAEIAVQNAELAALSASVAKGSQRTAEGLINSMLYDLYNDLRPLGRIGLLDQISQRADRYFAELPEEHRDADTERERSTMYNSRGDILLSQGKPADALLAYGASLSIRQQLLAELNPESNSAESRMLRRDISVSLEGVGDANLAVEDFNAARSAYDESLRIRQELVKADQTGAAAADLGVSYAKMGDLDLATGATEDALSRYHAAQTVLEELAKEEPKNLARQRDASAGIARIGEAMLANGDSRGAYESYLAGVTRLEKLNSVFPGNAEIRSDLAKLLIRQGNLNLEFSENEAAAENLEKSEMIFEELVDRDPSNLALRRSLSYVRGNLAQVLDALGDAHAETDPATALSNYRASLRESRRLDLEGDDSENWRIAQVVTLFKMAGLQATAAPDDAAALYRTALLTLNDLKNGGELTEEQSKWIEAIEAELDRL
ncbi:MAG: hypothetical protein ACI8UO_003866 [Verrucomicrobiales bacterium]|jgi:hypothetical protein